MAITVLVFLGCVDGGAPTRPSEFPCADPNFLFAPRYLGDNKGAPLPGTLQAGHDQVFFATSEAVYRAPVGGGDPVRLPDGSDSAAPGTPLGKSIHKFGERFFLFLAAADRAYLRELPASGTALVGVLDSLPMESGEDVPSVLGMDETYVYWQARAKFAIPTDVWNLHRMPWSRAGAAEKLLEGGLFINQLLIHGDKLVMARKRSSELEVVSMPAAGGSLTWYYPGLSHPLDIIGVDASWLYVRASARLSEGPDSVRVVQFPISGGIAPVKYLSVFSDVRGAAWLDRDRLVLIDFRTVTPGKPALDGSTPTFLTLPAFGGKPAQATCLRPAAGSAALTLTDRTFSANSVFLLVREPSSARVGLIRVWIP